MGKANDVDACIDLHYRTHAIFTGRNIMRLALVVLVGLVLAGCSVGQGTEASRQSHIMEVRPTEFTPLFNGKDLSGFYTFLSGARRGDCAR